MSDRPGLDLRTSRRLAWALWGVFLVVVPVVFACRPTRNIDAYTVAARAWLAGEPLYDDTGTGFLYLPHAAVTQVPFALLPAPWGGMCWRIVNILIFAWGARRLAQLAQAQHCNDLFLPVTLFAIPLALGSALNGQSNLCMAGLMMLAVAAVGERRWWGAAAFLWLAVLFKPLALILVLLLAALYPAVLLRLLILGVGALLLPYGFQMSGYVTAQYTAFLDCLTHSSHRGDRVLYTHIFGTLQLFDLDLPAGARNIVRVLAAGLTFALCAGVRLRRPGWEALVLIYGLSVGYLMVFNPRTEGVTYALVGPPLGVAFAWHKVWWRARYRRLLLVLMPLMAVLVVANYELGKLVLPTEPGMLFTPLVGCVFFTLMCLDAWARHPQQLLVEPAPQ